MKLNKKAGIATAVAAAAMLAITPAAFASNVLSVDGSTTPPADITIGGTMSSANISFLTDASTPATCTAGTAGGYVKKGVTVGANVKIGAITSMTFGAGGLCEATSLKYKVTIIKKAGSAEWGIYSTTTPTKGQTVVPIEIRGVTAQMKSTTGPAYTCELDASGTVRGTFNQSTQVLSIAPATPTSFPLAIQAFTGAGTKTPATATCGGQVYTGDAAQMTGSFALTTPGTGGIHM